MTWQVCLLVPTRWRGGAGVKVPVLEGEDPGEPVPGEAALV